VYLFIFTLFSTSEYAWIFLKVHQLLNRTRLYILICHNIYYLHLHLRTQKYSGEGKSITADRQPLSNESGGGREVEMAYWFSDSEMSYSELGSSSVWTRPRHAGYETGGKQLGCVETK
jgi:hypothetical protein